MFDGFQSQSCKNGKYNYPPVSPALNWVTSITDLFFSKCLSKLFADTTLQQQPCRAVQVFKESFLSLEPSVNLGWTWCFWNRSGCSAMKHWELLVSLVSPSHEYDTNCPYVSNQWRGQGWGQRGEALSLVHGGWGSSNQQAGLVI